MGLGIKELGSTIKGVGAGIKGVAVRLRIKVMGSGITSHGRGIKGIEGSGIRLCNFVRSGIKLCNLLKSDRGSELRHKNQLNLMTNLYILSHFSLVWDSIADILSKKLQSLQN